MIAFQNEPARQFLEVKPFGKIIDFEQRHTYIAAKFRPAIMVNLYFVGANRFQWILVIVDLQPLHFLTPSLRIVYVEVLKFF